MNNNTPKTPTSDEESSSNGEANPEWNWNTKQLIIKICSDDENSIKDEWCSTPEPPTRSKILKIHQTSSLINVVFTILKSLYFDLFNFKVQICLDYFYYRRNWDKQLEFWDDKWNYDYENHIKFEERKKLPSIVIERDKNLEYLLQQKLYKYKRHPQIWQNKIEDIENEIQMRNYKANILKSSTLKIEKNKKFWTKIQKELLQNNFLIIKIICAYLFNENGSIMQQYTSLKNWYINKYEILYNLEYTTKHKLLQEICEAQNDFEHIESKHRMNLKIIYIITYLINMTYYNKTDIIKTFDVDYDMVQNLIPDINYLSEEKQNAIRHDFRILYKKINFGTYKWNPFQMILQFYYYTIISIMVWGGIEPNHRYWYIEQNDKYQWVHHWWTNELIPDQLQQLFYKNFEHDDYDLNETVFTQSGIRKCVIDFEQWIKNGENKYILYNQLSQCIAWDIV